MAGIVRQAALGALALIAVLTAGCSGGLPPAGVPGTSTSASGVALVVPPVPDPLDPGGLRDTPCELIPERDSRDIGLPFAQEERAGNRVTCTWRRDKEDPNPLEALSIRFQSESGLATIARQCRRMPECQSWTVGTVSGYPVIRANGRLESKYGLCRLFVGVTDDVAFLVIDGDLATIREGVDEGDAGGPRCDRAERAATMAIQFMKAGR